MIILGVDPSSTSTGYGLLDLTKQRREFIACGCIRPPRGLPFEDRLVVIFEKLGGVIAEHSPDEAAIESTFYGKDATAASKLSHARGVLLLALRLAGLPIWHYTPAEVKRAVGGSGQATKRQVQYVTAKLLGLRELPKPLDASDALAIGLCHTFRPESFSAFTRSSRKPEVDELLRRMIRR